MVVCSNRDRGSISHRAPTCEFVCEVLTAGRLSSTTRLCIGMQIVDNAVVSLAMADGQSNGFASPLVNFDQFCSSTTESTEGRRSGADTPWIPAASSVCYRGNIFRMFPRQHRSNAVSWHHRHETALLSARIQI